MNKKTKTGLIILAVIAILIILAIPKLSSSDNSPAANKRSFTALPVKALVLKSESLQNNITTSGSILANEEVELKPEITGRIVNIAFREGSRVSRGDLLVKINDAELQAQLQRAKYRLKLLEEQEYRQRRLLEKEAISQEEYDLSLNELNIVKAEIELVKAQIDKTEIRAPFNGIVGLKDVSEGSIVTPSVVIARLQNINPVKIDFSIPEKYASLVSVGDIISFRVEGSSETHNAKVYAVEPKIDPVTRTLQMRASFGNPERNILPGSFADVNLVLHEVDDAIMVPTYALIPELKGQKVFLYKNGVVSSVKVEIGLRTDTEVQIVSGLNENDTLITSGILQLKPGAPVTLSEIN